MLIMIIPDLYIKHQSSAMQHRKIDNRHDSNRQVNAVDNRVIKHA